MTKSIKKNYILNLTNTVSAILFPLITFPYASRIMMADGIGLVNFFTSIINYITLFTCLGIPMYAIREIAKVRDDERERNKVAIEILLLHASLTMIGYVAVAIIAVTVAKVQVNIPLFLLLSTTIFFTTIGCEWFYQGTEDFKYITIRGLIVKIVSVVLLFLLVKTKEDIMWYAGYTVIGALGGNIFNFIRLRKQVSRTSFSFKELHPLRHLKPALHIFLLNLVISIYVNLNSVMLGFMNDVRSVGLFTSATKLSNVTLGIVSSLGTVMLPRLSNLIANGEKQKFITLSEKALSFVVALTLPLTIGLILTAPYIIPLFCGQSYSEAVLTLQIISPIIFFIGVSNVLGIQILYPQGQENKVIICTALGAIVNFILNLWLIPRYSQNGAAISTLFTEFIVTFSMIFIGKKYIPIKWKNKSFVVYTVASILMGIVVWGIGHLTLSRTFLLILSTSIGTIVYAFCLIGIKDPFYLQIKKIIQNKISRK